MNKLKWLLVVLLLLGFVAIPQLPLASNKVLTVLIHVFIAGAMASSWNIVAGYAGQINLGHAAFFGLGFLTTRLLWLNGYPLVLGILAGSVVATIFALIIGAPALRLRGAYFAIGTLALAQALNLTVSNVLPGNSALPSSEIVGYELGPRYYLQLGVLVLVVGVSYLLSRSRLGLGMVTVREDEEAAQSIGVNAFRHKLLAFVLSAFFAGLTGSTFAYFHISYYFRAAFAPVWTFDSVLVAFFGGIGTVTGPVVGALFYVVVRDVLATQLTNFHLIIFGMIFILVVLILPGGLMELWDRITSLRDAGSPRPRAEVVVEPEGEPMEPV